MSTSSERARRAAVAEAMINPEGVVQGGPVDNHAACLAATEAVTAQAIMAAMRAAAMTKAMAATAIALWEEMERTAAGGSQSPRRHREVSP
jgi:fructose-specific phosphotransferase system IIC component